MESLDLTEQLHGRSTRRNVIKRGAKLAYAVPLVAASFKLTSTSALAVECPPGYEEVIEDAGPNCCKCTVLGSLELIVINGEARCVAEDGTSYEARCVGLVASIP